MNEDELRFVDGGNSIIRRLFEYGYFIIKNTDVNVFPISNDSTGSTLDGYMGSKI